MRKIEITITANDSQVRTKVSVSGDGNPAENAIATVFSDKIHRHCEMTDGTNIRENLSTDLAEVIAICGFADIDFEDIRAEAMVKAAMGTIVRLNSSNEVSLE